MAEFTPLSMSHLFTTVITVALIVFLPYNPRNKSSALNYDNVEIDHYLKHLQ